MPDRNTEDIINDPINPEDFATEEEEEDTDIIDIDDEEIDPIGDLALDGPDMSDKDFDIELQDDSYDVPDDEIEPVEYVAPEEQIRWTTVPQENGDIWSEHINGFILRARPISAQQGEKIKYVAQLFKDNKMIEKGIIWIDQEKDAREYLQNIADRILDRLGLSNLSNMAAEPQLDVAENPEELDIDVDENPDELDINAGEDLDELDINI